MCLKNCSFFFPILIHFFYYVWIYDFDYSVTSRAKVCVFWPLYVSALCMLFDVKYTWHLSAVYSHKWCLLHIYNIIHFWNIYEQIIQTKIYWKSIRTILSFLISMINCDLYIHITNYASSSLLDSECFFANSRRFFSFKYLNVIEFCSDWLISR